MTKILQELGVTIRRLEDRDLPHVSAIEKSVYEDPWSDNLIQESLKAPMTYTLGAFRDHKVVGYAIFQVIFTEGHLLNLAVDKDFQQKGLGDFIVKLVIDEAKKKGALSLFLEVRPSNLAAKKLYEKNGFRFLITRENYYSNGESAIVMVLEHLT